MGAKRYDHRVQTGVDWLFRPERAAGAPAAAAAQLGAALCIASGGAPYEEARNRWPAGSADGMAFRDGWNRAAINRGVLERMGAIA